MGNPLDSFAHFLANRLSYGPGERDILIMHHEIGYKWPNGKEETRVVDFIHYGDKNGHTAMAKTVGLPTAIAARMVLDSKIIINSFQKIFLLIYFSIFVEEIQTVGMVLPIQKDVYKPILNRLISEGLNWTESIKETHN